MPEPAAQFTTTSPMPSPMLLTDRYMVRPPRKADRPMVSPLMLTDRLISLAVPVHRYQCLSMPCSWKGNMRVRAG